MRAWLPRLGRMAVTLVVVAIALVAGWRLWRRYQDDPWTRDGRVRADVVEVAADVAGLVTEVAVRDNQAVARGQRLFVLDRPRYALALRQAEAGLASQQAILAEARREARRNRSLGDLVAAETTEQSLARVAQTEAAVAQAQATVQTARLNLQRTEVSAPTAGILSNVDIKAGEYLPAGRAAVALVDPASLHVDGYFEETKLRRIQVGDRASVRIMGEPRLLYGHVQSIAAAVTDHDRTDAPDLIPSVNPTFSWVRLAQRIPVRVVLDAPPADVRLVAGRTATVTILDRDGQPRRAR